MHAKLANTVEWDGMNSDYICLEDALENRRKERISRHEQENNISGRDGIDMGTQCNLVHAM